MTNLVKLDGRELSKETLRAEICAFESTLRAHPGAFEQLETMHHFTDGIYARTVHMRAGDTVVGKIHKDEHLVVVSAGRARVVSEEFGAREIAAPQIFKSPPGVKRVLLILEDCIWTTLHKNPSNTEDLAVLEANLIAKDYSEVSL